MSSFSRRGLVTGLLTLAALAPVPARGARAWVGPSVEPVDVAVPNHAVGAMVAVVGRAVVRLSVDPKLDPGTIRVGDGPPTSITQRVLLKGQARARMRYLDDARNASRVAANVRDVLSRQSPQHKARFTDNHKAWSRTFARRVLAWHGRLQKSSVHGRTVRDEHGRRYLLEWAGASVSETAADHGPARLAKLPEEPSAPTLAAYERYIEALVAALA